MPLFLVAPILTQNKKGIDLACDSLVYSLLFRSALGLICHDPSILHFLCNFNIFFKYFSNILLYLLNTSWGALLFSVSFCYLFINSCLLFSHFHCSLLLFFPYTCGTPICKNRTLQNTPDRTGMETLPGQKMPQPRQPQR